MAVCPECDAEIEIDEFDVDKGEIISCPECGVDLRGGRPFAAGAGPGAARRGRLGGMTDTAPDREQALDRVLAGLDSVVVAFSGGRGQRLPGRARPPGAGRRARWR